MSGEKNKIWAIVLIGLLLAVALIPMTAYAATPKPMIAFTADKTSIGPGEQIKLTWTAKNANGTKVTSNIDSDWYYSELSSGSIYRNPTKTIIYTATVTGPGGTATAKVTIKVAPVKIPTVTLKASLLSINQGGSSVISWSSTNADTVTIVQPVGWFDVIGFVNGGVIAQGKSGSKTVSPTQTTTYTATATGPGGMVKASATVTVYKPKPTVKFTASPTTTSNGSKATLSWTVTDATNYWIVASGTGNIRSEGFPSVKLFSGSQVVFPTATTTYTLTASGSGGTTTATVTVIVIQKPPTVILTASPISVAPGGHSNLSWSITGANSYSIVPNVGSHYSQNVESFHGTTEVPPSTTTTYTLMASGPGGTTTTTVTVKVIPNKPTLTLTAKKTPLHAGDKNNVTVSYVARYAAQVTMSGADGLPGPRVLNNGADCSYAAGGTTIAIYKTTTFTVVAVGSGGAAASVITVNI